MQLFVVVVTVLCSAPLLVQSQTTTPTRTTTPTTVEPPTLISRVPPPERVTILPPRWPLCRLPAVCTPRSPGVCGRTVDGICRRFSNICELLQVARRDLGAGRNATWTHTQPQDCRTVRGVGAARANLCYQPCPRRPLVCRRTPRAQQICVRSRNGRACKVLANRCQLLNNNCHSRPRNNWLPTNKRSCGQMQLGDKPRECVPLIIRPVLPRPPTRPLTTEAPTNTTTEASTEPPTTSTSAPITISIIEG